MAKNLGRGLALLCGVVAFVGVTACGAENQVDGKAVVEVPAADGRPGGVCYLLEVERKDRQGKEIGESYICVSRAEYDRNNVGEQWVDANGVKRR